MTDGPENTCPVCGGHDVVGAHSRPSKSGEWLWACRHCHKCWTREQWAAIKQLTEGSSAVENEMGNLEAALR